MLLDREFSIAVRTVTGPSYRCLWRMRTGSEQLESACAKRETEEIVVAVVIVIVVVWRRGRDGGGAGGGFFLVLFFLSVFSPVGSQTRRLKHGDGDE